MKKDKSPMHPVAEASALATADTLINKDPQLFPFDDRVVVARPDVYPSRCVGQIIVRLKNGQVFRASGSLVSDYTVVTAGHVVKSADNKFLDIDRMTFTPAKNHQSQPYGVYDWMKMTAVFNGDNRDWCLISLTQAAGKRTGYLGANARLPISRWKSEGHHFSHIGFPGDHADEMWIDEDGVCTGIHNDRLLVTNIDAAAGQSGGPLTLNWLSNDPKVIGVLSGGPNPVEDPNLFTPGYEKDKDDTWMQWLCDTYGKLHNDDRFAGCSQGLRISFGDSTETVGSLPEYGPDVLYADDDGPIVRRCSEVSRTNIMTPANRDFIVQSDQHAADTLLVETDVHKHGNDERASDDFDLPSGSGPYLFVTDPVQPKSLTFRIYKRGGGEVWTDLKHGSRRGDDHIGPERKYVRNLSDPNAKFKLRIYRS